MALVGWVRRGPGWVKKEGIFDDSVINSATSSGFANGFLLGHLWDVLLWSRSSRGPIRYRQVARDGGAEGLSRGKRRVQANAGRYLSFCAYQWLNRVHSSPRPFLVVSPRCSRSAISAVDPHDHWRCAPQQVPALIKTEIGTTKGVSCA